MEAWRSLLASFVLAVLAAQALVAVVESRTGPVEQASEGSTLHLLSYAVFIQTLCVATLMTFARVRGTLIPLHRRCR
jgi:hypothetical protein